MEVLKQELSIGYFTQILFVTISPPLRKANNQFHIFADDMMIIKYIRRCSKHYMIYPEFDIKGRLHYHGLIYISDPMKWYKQILPMFRKIGFVDVQIIGRTFENKLNVLLYIRKHWMVTKDILNINDPIFPVRPCKHKYIGKSISDTKLITDFFDLV